MQSLSEVLDDMRTDALTTEDMLHRLRQHFWRLQREARAMGMTGVVDDTLAQIEGDPEAIRSTYYQIAITAAMNLGSPAGEPNNRER